MLHTLHDNIHLGYIIKGGNYHAHIIIIIVVTYSTLLPTTIPNLYSICSNHQALSTNCRRIHPRTNHRDDRRE